MTVQANKVVQEYDTSDAERVKDLGAEALGNEVLSLRLALEEQTKVANAATKRWEECKSVLDEFRGNAQRIKGLQGEVLRLQTSLSAQSEAGGASQKEWARKLHEAEEIVRQRESRVQALEVQLKESSSKSSDLVKKLHFLEESLQEKEQVAFKSITDLGQAQGAMEQQQRRIEQLEEELETLRSMPSAAALDQVPNDDHALVEVLEQQVLEFEKALSSQADKSSEALRRLIEREKQLEDKEKLVLQLQEQIRLLISQAEAAKGALDAKGIAMEELQHDAGSLRASLDEARTQIAEQSNIISFMEDQLQRARQAAKDAGALDQELQSVTTERDDLAIQLMSLKEELFSSTGDADHYKASMKNLEDERRRLDNLAKEREASLEEELKLVKAERDTYVNELSLIEGTDIGKELEIAQKQMEELTEERDKLVDLVKQQSASLAKLRSQLTESEGIHEAMEQEVASLGKSLIELVSK